jgi:hypothetical protein
LISVIDDTYQQASVRLARAAGEVANYCDSVEHNEATERAWVTESGATLREVATQLADAIGKDLVELYAARLAQIEQRGVAAALPGAFDGPAEARDARTWFDLQLVQVQHDRHYHPDVAGLTKYDQLRHYAFHLAKLAAAVTGGLAEESQRADVSERRLADTLLFGLTLATVMGQRLGPTPLPRRGG